MTELIKIDCESCLNSWEVPNGEFTTLICQECGSGHLRLGKTVEMACINGHTVTDNKPSHVCQNCQVSERSALRKLTIVDGDALNYINMSRKRDLQKFIDENELKVKVGKKETLEVIKIHIAEALRAQVVDTDPPDDSDDDVDKVEIKTRKGGKDKK